MSAEGVGRQFEIEGRTLGYPAVFEDACSAVGLFVVQAEAAQALIDASGFEVAPILPGRALLSLSCVHYRESVCGRYDEISLGFFVRKAGRDKREQSGASALPYLGTWFDIARDEAATFVWKLPVTTRLANDAGVRMWGFPKTVEKIDFALRDGRAEFALRIDDQAVLRYSVPARGKRRGPRSASHVYSIFEGAPCVTRLGHRYEEMGMGLRTGRLELGGHPVAEQLRHLGVGARPLLASWMGRLRFDVGPPEKL